MTTKPKHRVYLDLTHLGRHVTGIERVSIEQFEKVDFEGAELIGVRSRGLLSMILRQQFLLPFLALTHPDAHFVFPGFPPSPLFALARNRVHLYVHDTFLITRARDLSLRARIYMAPQFRIAARALKYFFVNSEKTRRDLEPYVGADAHIALYRPSVANHFRLDAKSREKRRGASLPLQLVSLGTVEPRKNYLGALAILDCLRARHDPAARLHIIGRPGWGEDAARIAAHPAVTVHGYLADDAVKALMESADLYLCTSHDEGLGLPLLEAQYAGLPAIAPDQPVFHEVLGQSGTFINLGRPADAADRIWALTQAQDWQVHQASAALENVRRWNDLAALDAAMARKAFVDTATSAPTAVAAARSL